MVLIEDVSVEDDLLLSLPFTVGLYANFTLRPCSIARRSDLALKVFSSMRKSMTGMGLKKALVDVSTARRIWHIPGLMEKW